MLIPRDIYCLWYNASINVKTHPKGPQSLLGIFDIYIYPNPGTFDGKGFNTDPKHILIGKSNSPTYR